MITPTALRLAPSGPPFTNDNGGTFSPGKGARLRLAELDEVMTGTIAIPAVADTIGIGGFGTAATVLTLTTPQAGLEYRAKLLLDVVNTSTNTDGEVVLYLDCSVDEGATWPNIVKNVHYIAAAGAGTGVTKQARSMEVDMVLTAGEAIGSGVITGTTASIKLRARASLPLGVAGSVSVDSLATSGGGTPVTGLAGTIHMELEECF